MLHVVIARIPGKKSVRVVGVKPPKVHVIQHNKEYRDQNKQKRHIEGIPKGFLFAGSIGTKYIHCSSQYTLYFVDSFVLSVVVIGQCRAPPVAIRLGVVSTLIGHFAYAHVCMFSKKVTVLSGFCHCNVAVFPSRLSPVSPSPAVYKCDALSLSFQLPEMSKRRNVELYTGEVQQPDRKEQIVNRMRGQLKPVFVFTPKSLNHIIPNSKEVKRILKIVSTPPNRTVHARHPRIRKTNIGVKFAFNPAEMEPDQRLTVQLEGFDPAPQSPTELISGRMTPSVDTSRFLLHDIRLVSIDSSAPFELLLGSNAFTLVSEYMHAVKALSQNQPGAIDRLLGEREWQMPELPGKSAMFEAKPQFSGPVEGIRDHCMHAVGFMDPEHGRSGYSSARRDPLYNGIYYVHLAHPLHGHMTEFGILSSEHAVAVYAQINWEAENVLFSFGTNKPVSDIGRQDRYLLMERSLIEGLVEQLSGERAHAVPLFETDRLVFELKRYVNPSNWASTMGCVAGTQLDDLNRDMHCNWVIELEYTLFEQDADRAIVTVPEVARKLSMLPHHLDNTEQIEEKIQAEAEFELRHEDMDVDLANLDD